MSSAPLVDPARTSSAASCPMTTIRPRHRGVRPFGQRERFFESPLLSADRTERTQGKWEVLVDFEDLPQFDLRVLEPAGVSQSRPRNGAAPED